MKQRIWFNRWFNSAYHFIDLIRNNPDRVEYEVFGTHHNPRSAVLQACDYSEIEPAVSGQDYIDFCLDFCRKYHIDIFIPRHQLILIAERMEEFRKEGVKVLVSAEPQILHTIVDKANLYDSFKENKIVELPDYHIVNNASQFKQAYNDLMDKGHKVCFKPVNGEGGSGFRIIDNQANIIDALYREVSHRISFDEAYKILSSQESFRELMVLEYLEGYEYSIDCLADSGNLIAAVPRKKVDERTRFLECYTELIEIAKKVSETYKLSYVFNIQLFIKNGIPKLLEINPRMSGGLHISCLSGVNFPYLGVKLLVNGSIDVPTPQFGIAATQIEKEIKMKYVL